MFRDHYDLEVSCASEAALGAYSAGIDLALRLDASGITELREAITRDGEFALARAALGRQLQIHGYPEEAAQQLHKSRALKSKTTPREQSAIDVIHSSATFNSEAPNLALNHVERYPQDVFILSHLVGPFGLLAFSGQRDWRLQNMTLLQSTKAAYPPNDWWHMTTRGFMAAEVGDLKQAREDGERAWLLCENGNCAHTLVHVHFEEGALNEGAAFIQNWQAIYGDGSDMRHHLLWHLALIDRENGADAHALLALFKRELDPVVNDPMPLTTFTDNAALLWRCKLAGMDIPGNISEDLLRYAATHYPTCGFAFADIHRVMATALADNQEQRQVLVDELTLLHQENETELAKCMLQFTRGFNAFADGNYADAVTLLEPAISASVLLGGSNPQRRIVEETFLEARNRAS